MASRGGSPAGELPPGSDATAGLTGVLTVEVVGAKALRPLLLGSLGSGHHRRELPGDDGQYPAVLPDTTCTVSVVDSEGRASSSGSGISDYRTGVARASCNPVWGETCQLQVTGGQVLRCTVRQQHPGRGRRAAVVCGAGALPLAACGLAGGHSRAAVVALAPEGEVRLVLSFADGGGLFGRPLASVCRLEGTRDGVPRLVRACCAAVENHGLFREGLYRVPGSKVAVECLAARCAALAPQGADEQPHQPFTAHDVADIHNVCVCARLLLRAARSATHTLTHAHRPPMPRAMPAGVQSAKTVLAPPA